MMNYPISIASNRRRMVLWTRLEVDGSALEFCV